PRGGRQNRKKPTLCNSIPQDRTSLRQAPWKFIPARSCTSLILLLASERLRSLASCALQRTLRPSCSSLHPVTPFSGLSASIAKQGNFKYPAFRPEHTCCPLTRSRGSRLTSPPIPIQSP